MSVKTDKIVENIIKEIEAGVMPWLKPWKNGNQPDGILPYNASTKKEYRGINIMLLWDKSDQYGCNGWVTYKQAQKIGGQVRKNEKGTQIVFWKFIEITDKVTEEKKTIPFAQVSTVFNLEQVDGIEIKKVEQEQTKALELAKKNGIDLRHGGNKAYFSPVGDYVKVPQQEQFESIESYEATVNHEGVHWTGHHSRLDREFGKRFGDEAYGMEELVAELGAAFLCAHQGIEGKLQHAEYISSWLTTLKKDKKAIFTAATKAQEAVDYLLKNNQD